MQSTPDRIGQRILCPKCYRAVSVPDPELAAFDHVEDTTPTEREPDLHPRNVRVMAPLATRTTSAKDNNGGVVLFQPSASASADAMTDLTAAITMRMKPPPEVPPPDLKLSTAVWLTLTATGIVFWCATVIYQSGPLHYVTALAVIELSIGIGWIAYVAGRTHWLRGLLTLFPPIALFRLVRGEGPDHNRPLRFVLSGLLLLALVYANPVARAAVRQAFGMDEPRSLPPSIPEAPAERLALFANRYDETQLLAELKRIGKSGAVNAAKPADRPAIVAELRQIVKRDDRPEVTAAAFEALIAWAGEEAKPDLLAAVQSPNQATRQTAVPLVAGWKDAETAKALVPLLRKEYERRDACDVLKKIGSPAEAPLLEFMVGLTDQKAGFAAMDVLKQIGGESSIQFLTTYSKSATDQLLGDVALRKAGEIQERLKKGP